jgi:hypothetical protein
MDVRKSVIAFIRSFYAEHSFAGGLEMSIARDEALSGARYLGPEFRSCSVMSFPFHEFYFYAVNLRRICQPSKRHTRKMLFWEEIA